MRMRDDGYYVEEVAAVLKVSTEDAKKLSYDMRDGDIDLGVCIYRKEQDRIRGMIADDEFPTE
jgi:hypothetical protein